MSEKESYGMYNDVGEDKTDAHTIHVLKDQNTKLLRKKLNAEIDCNILKSKIKKLEEKIEMLESWNRAPQNKKWWEFWE